MQTAAENKAAYRDQLPRPSKVNFGVVFQVVASLASILSILTSPAWMPNEAAGIVYAVAICALTASLIIFIVARERQKLHRYAQAIPHLHFTAHIARDYLAKGIHFGNRDGLEETLLDIANSAASCFSIITGRYCQCSIKELTKSKSGRFQVRIVCYNSLIKMEDKSVNHSFDLEKFTSLKNIYRGINGCSRYYISNDLPRDWKNHNYENGIFAVVPPPSIEPAWFGLKTVVKNWPLPYKSTLVFPIRYVLDSKVIEDEAKGRKKKKNIRIDENTDVWGFLCIDCESTNVFDQRFCPELGATYADILYTILSETKHGLDRHKPMDANEAAE